MSLHPTDFEKMKRLSFSYSLGEGEGENWLVEQAPKRAAFSVGAEHGSDVSRTSSQCLYLLLGIGHPRPAGADFDLKQGNTTSPQVSLMLLERRLILGPRLFLLTCCIPSFPVF